MTVLLQQETRGALLASIAANIKPHVVVRLFTVERQGAAALCSAAASAGRVHLTRSSRDAR